MQPGVEQYAVRKFATALEALVRNLAENTGVNANEVISKLYATHEEGKKNYGFGIEVRINSRLPVKELFVELLLKAPLGEGAVDLNTLRKMLNEGNTTLRLLTWDY
jgi:T-complex protein 1 subunit theta